MMVFVDYVQHLFRLRATARSLSSPVINEEIPSETATAGK
jgi:hypothetical protein